MSLAHGYEEIKTPLLYNRKLWEISGHWGKYRENMFVTEAEDHPIALKPMNCPGHCSCSTRWEALLSRAADALRRAGPLHRNEPGGTLHGLLRVRQFLQDDAHIFCTEEQIADEVLGCLDAASRGTTMFGSSAARALDPARAADRHRRDVGQARRRR